jgi:protoporphyrinogen oxidase
MIQTVSDWEPLQRFTAYEWLRAFFGKKVTEIIWDPLLKGKFERYYDKVTMSWLWGRIAIRAKSREATGTEKLGYVHSGFRTIVDKLVEEITARGGIIYTEVSVKCVIREKNGSVKVFIEEEIKTTFDTVVFTTPAHVAVSLLSDNPEITQEYKDKAASISYLDAVVMPFATTEPIGPYFWYNINDDRVPFLLLLSTSALTGTESFDGKHIYYIGAYVHHDHRYMTMPEETLKQEWYDGLKVMFPDFDRSTVIDDVLFRLKDAQHIVDIGFRENKILPYETPVKGIFLSNFTQIYPDDRGTNFAVREGHVIAGIVAEYLIQRSDDDR